MKLSPKQLAFFRESTSDFRNDHSVALSMVRDLFNIPSNRYFTVRLDGTVEIDTSRTRTVEPKKLSKSDQ